MSDADLILYNTKVYTLDPKQPKADAIAIKGNKIVAVGSNAQILKLKKPGAKAIDLEGKTVLPGFVDCHIHIRSYAQNLEEVELRDVVSIRQLQRILRKAAAEKPSNAWITARGFDEEKFREKRLPTRHDLDKAVSENPVFITRVCGHLSVANTKALELAHITRNTSSFGIGTIEKDSETGELTGVLRENAENLVAKVIPDPKKKDLLRIYERAFSEAAKKGLTAVHCVLRDPDDVKIIHELHKLDKLKLRVYLMTPIEYLHEIEEFKQVENSKIRIGSVKILADGSLGARTAALTEPYMDDKTAKGVLIYSQKNLERLIERVHGKGFQLAVHAIGDKGAKSVLDAFEKALSKKPRKNHRHRIEHVSVMNENLIKRMSKLEVIASVQPHFVVSDFWLTKRLGQKRARWTYAFKSFIESGIVVCGGSDGPIEPIDPLLGVWAAVARENFRQERLSVDEAIRFYTVNAAYASFEEDVKGILAKDRLADLTVLAQDPYTINTDKISAIKVYMTIVDGEIVYARNRGA